MRKIKSFHQKNKLKAQEIARKHKEKEELNRINSLRAAYNADKSAFNNKVGDLE